MVVAAGFSFLAETLSTLDSEVLRFCQSFTVLWQDKREHLESDYRVIFLFPHMSSQVGH